MMECLKVRKLNPNRVNTVGIFSPSEPVVDSRKEKFENGVRILKDHNFDIYYSKNCFAHTGYSAGSIEQRVDDFHELLHNPKVDVLLASWGGKGCNELIEYIDYDLVKKAKKPILGFSDPCVLANNISARTGLVTFYGPNVLGKLNESDHSDLNLLQSFTTNRRIISHDRQSFEVIEPGKFCGRLIGGNLSTFLLGVVCSKIDRVYFKNAVLLWEDLGNPPQIVNQYLTALDNLGVFELIGAMVVGQFISEDSKPWKKTDPFRPLKHFSKKYGIPTIQSSSFGHSDLENPIFPIGALCEVDSDLGLIIKEEITQ